MRESHKTTEYCDYQNGELHGLHFFVEEIPPTKRKMRKNEGSSQKQQMSIYWRPRVMLWIPSCTTASFSIFLQSGLFSVSLALVSGLRFFLFFENAQPFPAFVPKLLNSPKYGTLLSISYR
jgi:hypothetical protein